MSRGIGNHPLQTRWSLLSREQAILEAGDVVPDELTRLSLPDLLPTFMSLSAAKASSADGSIEDQWMHLAGVFMAQATIEQLGLYDVYGEDVLEEAFAWGWAASEWPDEATDRVAINKLFRDEDSGTEVEGWKEMKDHYRQLARERSKQPEFDMRLNGFLQSLFEDQPKPVLKQAEESGMYR